MNAMKATKMHLAKIRGRKLRKIFPCGGYSHVLDAYEYVIPKWMQEGKIKSAKEACVSQKDVHERMKSCLDEIRNALIRIHP